jgi:hypothetical protein
VGVGHESQPVEVAVLVGFVDLVGDLSQPVECDRAIGDVELGGINARFLEHHLVVEEGAGVGVEGEGVGFAPKFASAQAKGI